ncbi:LOW QUALITY PROTEIN: cytochrome P450 2J2-like [Notamacropus eugenii]|uniref:LOW QUALITY PROTEIN: cytochrome P450 2J2-like n=1 Tax=Notamacropus eugenii TaxID=9315 RepID=UPI003B670DF1
MQLSLVTIFPSLWERPPLATLLLFSAILLILAQYLHRRRRQHLNYPPGPPALPILGNLFQINFKNPQATIQKLAREYGNVFCTYAGNLAILTVTGLPLIKEVLVNQDQVFIDRPKIPVHHHVFKTLGQPFDTHFQINNAVSNIICSITFGHHFDYHDSQFQELLKSLDEVLLLEARWESQDDIHPSFSEENLVFCTLDLFLAGTETTSTTLRWALLYMALNPEIQGKIQAEIDRVLGQSRYPTMADKENMPYTNAAVHEVQRMGNIVPFNVPRVARVDTTVAGYHVPKGTVLSTNLTTLHRDPKEWATPETFNPEHFLENGQFKKRESFLPFSIGKSVCLGEQLARTELFLFFTSLLQKFTFQAPANTQLSLDYRIGLTCSPVSYKICALPRVM